MYHPLPTLFYLSPGEGERGSAPKSQVLPNIPAALPLDQLAPVGILSADRACTALLDALARRWRGVAGVVQDTGAPGSQSPAEGGGVSSEVEKNYPNT